MSGTASVGSTITGLGSFDLTVGENELLVSVTNDAGLVNTYTIKVVKPGNGDASLESITSNRGELTLDNGTYKIYVDNDINSIKFTVVPKDSDATVEMLDVYNLNFNGNNFEIIIRAEDGETTNTIPIYVYRYKHIESVNIIPEQVAINVG